MIQKIQQRRFQDIRNRKQLSFESGYDKIKRDLRSERLLELKHHLPKSIRDRPSIINPILHKEFL